MVNENQKDNDDEQASQVYDLPQLYTHPSFPLLLSTLNSLALKPTTFSSTSTSTSIPISSSHPHLSSGLPTYLTQIISSPLTWLSAPQREEIYTLASTRLAERAGRSAAPAMTRSFEITDDITVKLHEPSLTGDNLGLKTWSSSLMLAKRLPRLNLPRATAMERSAGAAAAAPPLTPLRILELGAGTGLVGIAAACIFRCAVVVSDLPEITPNLAENVARNSALLSHFAEEDAASASVEARALDWADSSDVPTSEGDRFPLILAADPLYSSEHPRLLVGAVERWLGPGPDARFVVELPLREGYGGERREMRRRLGEIGLAVNEEGEDVGFDDWEGRDGGRVEGRYEWSVWGWGQ